MAATVRASAAAMSTIVTAAIGRSLSRIIAARVSAMQAAPRTSRRPRIGKMPVASMGASTDHRSGNMGARTVPRPPQERGWRTRIHFRPPPLVRRALDAIDRWPAPPPQLRTLTVIAAAVAFVAALTYVGADEFSHRAVDQRAATEATSLAKLTGQLATADTYNTYLEMLRYDDQEVRTQATPHDVRVNGMQRLLYLNTNNLSSLTIADRSGIVIASTDTASQHPLDSVAYRQARGTLTPSNTDIILTDAGHPGYIEFAVPLKDGDGATWGVLLGRADPSVLWKSTLAAAVDGSRNVVLNGSGQFAAGVPDPLLKQPWRGQPINGGGIRAEVGGVPSICGLSAVGAGSQIDRGFTVASCLPSALIEAEHTQAIGKQGWITISGAVLAVALAGTALYFADRRRRPLLMLTGPAEDAALPDWAGVAEPAPPAARPVDTAALLEAYERRNERLAEQLREEVRARLLLASTQADEAYRRIGVVESDTALHREAMDELEDVRDRELRMIEQELYPAVVRLGLPNALKAVRRDLQHTIDLTLELDPLADAVDDDGERAAIGLGRRLVLYRLVLEGARVLAAAGATDARVTLARTNDAITLALETTSLPPGADVTAAFGTARLATEAYAGTLEISSDAARTCVTAVFGASPPSAHSSLTPDP